MKIPETIQYGIYGFSIGMIMILTFFVHSLPLNILGGVLALYFLYKLNNV
jgi:hypothetical protein